MYTTDELKGACMWGGMNVSPRANPEPQVYGEAEDAIAAGGGGKGGGGAGGSQERPRLTAEALMRVVEWKVREHGNKDEMKRVGAALHATPVGASSAGGVSSSNHRKGAGGGGGGGGAMKGTANGMRVHDNGAFQPSDNGH